MSRSRLLLALCAVVLSGCSAESPEARAVAFEDHHVPAPLHATSWDLVQVEHAGRLEDVRALKSSLSFAVDSVSGRTCNSYGAGPALTLARGDVTLTFALHAVDEAPATVGG